MKNQERPYKVCIVTTTRADWGLLQPLAGELKRNPHIDLAIVASNMHLMEEFGMTVTEISDAGFDIAGKVDMRVDGDDEISRAKAMARCLGGMAEEFGRLSPDALIILGDRYEMLAVASAAAVMHIPVVHIAGGEISEGANDDSFRHAITKLSHLHLTATEPYRRRVIQMGEEPDRVFNTGAIGVWNATHIEPCSLSELESFLGMQLAGESVAVVTYHPATNDTSLAPGVAMDEFLAALDDFPELKYVITYPNNDAGGTGLIGQIRAFADSRQGRVCAVPSLGMRRYHSLLRHARMVIGNSSSGIVEVPSYGIPTVDVGIRQRGRIAADSVIHCGADRTSVSRAIGRALVMDCRGVVNPYGRPDTLAAMTDAVTGFLESLPVSPKHFHDLNI
ncbi:MAG: UDP-N-acetylglucosamine 2-epimerase (hydrolyzing) [Muribaculaceae bacterium]|nr:UDP-N-acetylglucosamine 2-epimerase (hydrolyzing) [Muribaculaceae bacterium]